MALSGSPRSKERMTWKHLEMSGWGRIKRAPSKAARPERANEIDRALGETNGTGLITYGAGRSYGDSALNTGGQTCLTERLDRVLDFDEMTGIVEVEPGVTFRRLMDVFLPK